MTQDRIHDPGHRSFACSRKSTCEASIDLKVEITAHDLIVGVESRGGDLVIADRVQQQHRFCCR
jgi:hypothetical protein